MVLLVTTSLCNTPAHVVKSRKVLLEQTSSADVGRVFSIHNKTYKTKQILRIILGSFEVEILSTAQINI